MKKEIVPKLKKVMDRAQDEAKMYDDNVVRPEHIILSMVNDGDNRCVNTLKAMSIDLNELYDQLSQYTRDTHLNISANNPKRFRMSFSDETQKILKMVDKESDNLNDHMIDTAHIMMEVLKNKKNNLNKLFSKFKITYNKFNSKLMDLGNFDIPERKKKQGDNIRGSYMDDDGESEDLFGGKGRSSKKNRKLDSKTPVLDNFCRDISKSAEEDILDPVVGRKDEIKRVSQILSRRKKNNPVLIGEPGVGKTAIVEGLAILIKEGKAPRVILD